MAVDPVCGMDVEPSEAAASAEYEGRTYYFCAEGCKERFEADPRRYPGGEGDSTGRAGKESLWARLFKG